MRTSTLLVLSLSTAATLVTAEKEGGGGGALQALLERMQTKKQQNQARALGAGHAAVRPPPEDYSNGTDSHNSTSSAPHSNKSHPKSTKDSSSSSAKSDSASTKHGKKVHHDRPAPSAVESSAKSRLRSSDSARRALASDKKSKTQASSTSALEKELHIVESGGRLPQGVRTHGENAEIKTASAGKAAAATDKLEKRAPEKTVKTFGKKEEELKKPEDKRWVWGTAIIQDDTPAASNVPAVGENANYLNSAAANTPTATLAAPSFPPLAAELPSSQSAAALQSKVASRQKMSDRKKAAQAPAAPAKEKRWTWGNEIIQDGDENAPPVGENANLLSKGTTIAMNTPVAQLTPPSFPPLADATTSAEPATETFKALESNEGEGAEAAAQVVEQASSTLSAVAAEMTSGTPDIEALLNKLQEEINALANAYSQVTKGGDVVDAAAETSPAENAKRWVWGPSIIQDDTPASAAPPIGQNANLLNPAIPVETPSNKPLAPSFPARVGLATAPVSLASINNLAAAPASPAPVTPPVSVPAVIDTAADSTSTTTSRMNRKSQADSIRSARAAALKTRSAAMEWHLVNKKRQVGGMAKQHKRV